MRSMLVCLFVGLATGYLGDKLLVSAQISHTSDDLYLEGQSSGGFGSDDEDDDNFSGSGSSELHLGPSDVDKLPEILPPSTTYSSETSTVQHGDVLLKENTILTSGETGVLHEDGQGDRNIGDPEEITSESMWHRTEVLASVIACGVVGFLCAVFLVLVIAYRMKKKDEGSYVLGVARVPPSAYHKEPAKEFYA
ncbi:unnamed protein product [Merluccius merluccius]